MIERLTGIISGERILQNEPMKNHTSFRVGGPARYMVLPETADELAALCELVRESGINCYIMGNGSNLLVSDDGIDGLVIKTSGKYRNTEVCGNVITACSGALLSQISSLALSESLTGFEHLSGIPGSLGGAVFMNAGAYGSEIADVVTKVTYADENGKIVELGRDALGFSYRHSFFSDRNCVIISADIELKPGCHEEIKAEISETTEKRRSKQPLEYPSAGSTFKRPEGFFAAKLIEDAGLKGMTVGGAQVSKKHCGFIINTGNATAADIKELIKQVQYEVERRFGVILEPEVRMI